MRAIISVWDKTGLLDFGRGLAELGVEIYSTGGTYSALESGGVPVKSVSEITGFPEIMDGRVKTLHPLISGGILARRDSPEHMAQAREHGIEMIDLVVVNLYPFLAAAGKPGASDGEIKEMIDIGGPTMIRAAAKNYPDVLVVVDSADYDAVLQALRRDQVAYELRRSLAAKAFQHTASYDTHIAQWMRGKDVLFPDEMTIALKKRQDLRYGENPHQQAAFYREVPPPQSFRNLAEARQLNGKELSFCNTLDLDAAMTCVADFAAPTVAILKHTNPCGLACAEDLLTAYRRAHAGDPVSAFGGAIGLNRVMDADTAREIAQAFYEDVIAPGYSPEALEILRAKKNLRVLEASFLSSPGAAQEHPSSVAHLDFKRVAGGFLLQTWDRQEEDDLSLKVVTERDPTLDELTDLVFAWRTVKHVKSNAIVVAKDKALVGVGAGQMSRVDSVEIAVRKAGPRSIGSVMASDAFFPQADGVVAAAKGGITAVIQPGGSIRDEDVIREANRHHIAMVFTGRRHFRH